MTSIDEAFARTQAGNHDGFAAWVRLCEPSVRESLRSFAARVDTEAVVQETLLRMWVVAPTLELDGENASRAFACRVARNLALSEARRTRAATFDPIEPPLDASVPPDSPSDEGLLARIRECFAALGGKPKTALRARVDSGGLVRDAALAERLGMTLNTFLQNIVRARKSMDECLRRHGVLAEELSS